jgi:hypothetical protein
MVKPAKSIAKSVARSARNTNGLIGTRLLTPALSSFGEERGKKARLEFFDAICILSA